MHKLLLLLAFVLLSQGTCAFRIKRERGDGGGDYMDWTESPYHVMKQHINANQASNGYGGYEIIILQNCLESCPVTSEYNPVCGTNYVTYDNPGRLECAQACGVDVAEMKKTRCSVA